MAEFVIMGEVVRLTERPSHDGGQTVATIGDFSTELGDVPVDILAAIEAFERLRRSLNTAEWRHVLCEHGWTPREARAFVLGPAAKPKTLPLWPTG